MSTPTATPRTDAAWTASFSPERANFSVRDECEKLETELTAACSLQALACRKLDAAETEIARLRAQNDQFSDNLSSVGKAYNAEKARAEKAEAEVERLTKQIKDDNRAYGCELRDPTATLRTDNAWRRYNRADLPDPKDLVKESSALETELAAARSERDLAITRVASILWSGAIDKHTCGDVQKWVEDYTAELARLRAQENDYVKLIAEVLKCNPRSACDQPDNQLEAPWEVVARLRAELAVSENWVEHHSKHADDLIGENVKLRADLERFTGHGLLDCHAICDQRDAAVAERDQLRAEVERLKELLRIESASAQHALAAAERAEAEVGRLRECVSTPAGLRLQCGRLFPDYEWNDSEFIARLRALAERAEKSERLWKEFITLMDITEESDSGYEFNPNKISSCRAIDGRRLNEILIEARQIVFKQ